MTQEELVQEVLDRVLQSSTGVEDLETVTSLSGVKSLPGEKDGKMVNVPLELIGKKTPLPRWNRLRQQPSAGLPHAFPHGWKQATFYLTRVPNRAAA